MEGIKPIFNILSGINLVIKFKLLTLDEKYCILYL